MKKIDWELIWSKTKIVLKVIWKYAAKYLLIAGVAFFVIRLILNKFISSSDEKLKKVEKDIKKVKETIKKVEKEKEEIKKEHEKIKQRHKERKEKSKKYFID